MMINMSKLRHLVSCWKKEAEKCYNNSEFLKYDLFQTVIKQAEDIIANNINIITKLSLLIYGWDEYAKHLHNVCLPMNGNFYMNRVDELKKIINRYGNGESK